MQYSSIGKSVVLLKGIFTPLLGVLAFPRDWVADGLYSATRLCPRLVTSHEVAADWVGDIFPQAFKVRAHKPGYWVNFLLSRRGNDSIFFLPTLAVSLLLGSFL